MPKQFRNACEISYVHAYRLFDRVTSFNCKVVNNELKGVTHFLSLIPSHPTPPQQNKSEKNSISHSFWQKHILLLYAPNDAQRSIHLVPRGPEELRSAPPSPPLPRPYWQLSPKFVICKVFHSQKALLVVSFLCCVPSGPRVPNKSSALRISPFTSDIISFTKVERESERKRNQKHHHSHKHTRSLDSH